MSSSIDRPSEPDQIMIPGEPNPDENGAVILRPGEDLRTQLERLRIDALRTKAKELGILDTKSIEGEEISTRRLRLVRAIVLRMRDRGMATMNPDGDHFLTRPDDVGAAGREFADAGNSGVGVYADVHASSEDTGPRVRVNLFAKALDGGRLVASPTESSHTGEGDS